MNGRAEILSEVGVGTRVTLVLPRAASQKPSTSTPEVVAEPLNKRLVLVEDNEEVAASLVPILESLGCQVTHVDRASKARELLENGTRPDLVLSDVVMPGEMDGVALAQYVRRTWPNSACF